jgi:SAM-dependent methyltransferase
MQSAIKEWNGHVGPVLDAKNGFDIIDCEICGYKHATPVPTEQELEEIYRHEYYTDEKPLYIEHFKQDLDWWNIAYGDRYDSFEQMLGAGRRRLLDIGSGPGYFLLHGQQRGWEVTGIEPSRRAAEHARTLGVEIIEEFLDEALAARLGQFDVVHMSEVLEHIPDPKALLRIAHRLLKPGGVLCAVVPNDYSPFQLALRKTNDIEPWWVAPPHHLNYFDFDSIDKLLRKTGFTDTMREATFPIDLFLLMGDNYVGDDVMGRHCHAKRKTLERTLHGAGMNELKRKLFRSFADLGIGREICVYGRRAAI